MQPFFQSLSNGTNLFNDDVSYSEHFETVRTFLNANDVYDKAIFNEEIRIQEVGFSVTIKENGKKD